MHVDTDQWLSHDALLSNVIEHLLSYVADVQDGNKAVQDGSTAVQLIATVCLDSDLAAQARPV